MTEPADEGLKTLGAKARDTFSTVARCKTSFSTMIDMLKDVKGAADDGKAIQDCLLQSVGSVDDEVVKETAMWVAQRSVGLSNVAGRMNTHVLKDMWAVVETVGSALPYVGACFAVVGFIVDALDTKLANDDAALEMRRTCEILTECVAMVMPVLRAIMTKMPDPGESVDRSTITRVLRTATTVKKAMKKLHGAIDAAHATATEVTSGWRVLQVLKSSSYKDDLDKAQSEVLMSMHTWNLTLASLTLTSVVQMESRLLEMYQLLVK